MNDQDVCELVFALLILADRVGQEGFHFGADGLEPFFDEKPSIEHGLRRIGDALRPGR